MVNKKYFMVLFSLVLMIVFSGLATASLVNCWADAYNTDEATCEANAECNWVVTEWGSWCEQKGCWNLQSSDNCAQSNNASSNYYINATCSWDSTSSSWCSEINCWVFDGDQTACEAANSTYGIYCNWVDTYDVTNWDMPCSGPPEKRCWTNQNQSSCQNVTGCSWGICDQKSCWDYSSSGGDACEVEMGYNGKLCKWSYSTWGAGCIEQSCWNHNNKTGCNADNCTWSGSYCNEISCSKYSGTNSTYCINNSAGIACSWDSSGNWCSAAGCWNTYNQADCQNLSGCYWESYTSGWCEMQGCWTWDNQSVNCTNSTLHPSLSCVNDNSTGNDWCFENVSAKGCGDITNNIDCMDTFYCWWNKSASTCNDPNDDISTGHVEWNPGCYIFDHDSLLCQNTTGCYNTSKWDCETNASVIPDGQLNCTVLNNKSTCNEIAMLSTCCKWQGNSCVSDRFDASCRDEMKEPPEGAYYCEDYVAYTDNATCLKIAGSPWFMPCYWNITNSRCQFKESDIFGTGERNILKIDNEKNCVAAGGIWVKDTYASSNDNNTAVQLSLGRCDFNFDDERNCDKECYACDFTSNKNNYSTASDAEAACLGSKLGICGFTNFTSRDGYGRWGICEPKKAFREGLVSGDCRSDCNACTYTGDTGATKKFDGQKQTYDSCLAPSCYCENSPAKCKWIADPARPTDESYGRCGQGSEKTCEDKCDKCYDETICKKSGGKGGNSSLAAVCEWSSGICKYKSGADNMEICWDGVDNNGDNKIDCADSMCYSDSFCGGGFMFGDFGVDCFVYTTNDTCIGAGCAWINESWDSWCDMLGAACWKYDGNESQCLLQNASCEWHSGFGGFCEQDWDMGGTMSSCISYNMTYCQNATGSNNNCTWVVDDWCQDSGGWCWNNPAYTWTSGHTLVDCALYNGDSAACIVVGAADAEGDYPCAWTQDTWCLEQGTNAGKCDHMSFGCYQFNQTECTDDTNSTYNRTEWCGWRADSNSGEGGWCESKKMMGGSGSCWEQTSAAGCTGAGCKWQTGFCDPIGFGGQMMPGGTAGSTGGGMGGSGMQCMSYDGNQTQCSNQTGCGWFAEPWPYCDVNFQSNCGQYSYNQAAGCENETATLGRCKWNSVMGYCEEKPFECYWNTTLQTNLTECGNHFLCYNTTGSCLPLAYNATTRAICQSYNATLFRWMDGWCNPKMATQFFGGMEMSAPPVPLGTDPFDVNVLNEVDILDFGMKDMGNAYGFGIRVHDVTNSSACNGVKLSSGTSGTGRNRTAFYWYLDTDGNTTNSCTARHNSSLTGFEFYIKNQWRYDTSSASVSESPAVYRCASSAWTLAEIKVSSERKSMCNKIGGAMVALEMNELEKFSDSYTVGLDMRVAVASAGGNDNVTNVSDQAVPGWATPGAFDFNIDDFNMFKMETDVTKKAAKEGSDKGYIDYASDADCWTEAGCGNYTCKDHPYCVNGSYGVESATFTDTKVPKLVGLTKETYPNSTLIAYFTNKPSNGSLSFYGSDSTCKSTSLNATIYDTGLINANLTRTYKLWHLAEIYNDGGNHSLDYDLVNNTAYYFKVRICDDSGKCGESKCSKFVTAPSASDCPYCKFVSKINAPWNVYYDLDQNGAYEHWQGHIVKPEDGMLTNYSSGQRANILLNTSDGAGHIEFINVTLTKTGMSPKIREVSKNEYFKNGTATTADGKTVGYVGMIEDVRDKIVNNLYPRVCRVKMPGTGPCDELWHCDSNGTKCINRTANATLITNDSTSCTWQIPYCEFSQWSGGRPGTSTSSSGSSSSSSSGGGGGGSGGGAATSGLTYVVTAEQLKEGYSKYIGSGSKFKFTLGDEVHYATLNEVTLTGAKITVESTPQKATLLKGENRNFNLDGDNYYDVNVKLDSINYSGDAATLTLKTIRLQVPAEEIKAEIKPDDTSEEELGLVEETGEFSGESFSESSRTEVMVPQGKTFSDKLIDLSWLWITIIVIAVLAMIGVYLYRRGTE